MRVLLLLTLTLLTLTGRLLFESARALLILARILARFLWGVIPLLPSFLLASILYARGQRSIERARQVREVERKDRLRHPEKYLGRS